MVYYWHIILSSICRYLIVCKIARWFQKIHQALYIATHTLLHLLCYGFSISNIFLYIFFNLRWDAFTFQLIHETNTRESSEFLETYLFTSECGLLVMGYILLMVIEYFAIKWSRQRSISMPWYVSMPIAALFIYNGIFFCFQNFDSTRDNANDYNTLIMRNMLWKLHLSVQQYDVEKADLDICAQNQEIMAVDSCSYTSPNVVIIIGESFIKRHSSLYGYNKTTNPNLEKLRQTGNLSVFTDVITTRHGTSEAFKLFLSMACIKDSIRWCDTPYSQHYLNKQVITLHSIAISLSKSQKRIVRMQLELVSFITQALSLTSLMNVTIP